MISKHVVAAMSRTGFCLPKAASVACSPPWIRVNQPENPCVTRWAGQAVPWTSVPPPTKARAWWPESPSSASSSITTSTSIQRRVWSGKPTQTRRWIEVEVVIEELAEEGDSGHQARAFVGGGTEVHGTACPAHRVTQGFSGWLTRIHGGEQATEAAFGRQNPVRDIAATTCFEIMHVHALL